MKNRRYFNPSKRRSFFEKILMEVPSTNTFDLSFSNKLSFNMGQLIPLMCQEVVPGDKIVISEEHMVKMSPLVTPVMHRCTVDLHAFFVPNRLLWDNFEAFQAYDTLNEIPEHPSIDLGDMGEPIYIQKGSLMDYLGVPTSDTVDISQLPNSHPLRKINALPFAGYYKIFNDYFRDQNLQNEVPDKCIDGDQDDFSNVHLPTSIKNRCWEKDYFTSCLPFAQKGQEVVLPLGDYAPIEFNQDAIDDQTAATKIRNHNGDLMPDAAGSPLTQHSLTDSRLGNVTIEDNAVEQHYTFIDNSKSLRANLEDATAASVNDLRLAVRLQEFFERNARLGTRYIEQMLGKFGVRISDARAHRAEFVGSTRSYINFGEVLQTSQTDTTPLAQQAGHGMNINKDFLANHYCEEHGFFYVIASILPETSYHQGLHKKFQKNDILDYYDPMFANLGEQAVTNSEIYAHSLTPDVTFGYQSRYAELKYNMHEVHGDFRDTLADWHMSRAFASTPVLNTVFVTADPTHRIFADTSPETQKMYAWFHFNVMAKRKIPFFSTPTFASPLGKQLRS